ncbi:MAG: tetratricopeptide repeat protein [Henriciella sp.]|jgi:predicted Zn-dependent protease
MEDIAAQGNWHLLEDSGATGPFQVVFSSHGVPEGSFEFKSSFAGLPGKRLYINTSAADLFESGVVGIADTFDGLVDVIRHQAGDDRIILFGAGPGGFAAIRAGIALKAETVLAISPIINLDTPLSPSTKIANASAVPEPYRSLEAAIIEASETQFILMAAEWDIFHIALQSSLAHQDHVSSFGLLNIDTGVPAPLKQSGQLVNLYSLLLSGGDRDIPVKAVGALSQNPEIASNVLAAKIAATQGNWDEAVPLLKNALEVIPNCEIALEQLGAHALTAEDKQEALNYYSQCAEINDSRKVYKNKLSQLVRSLHITDPKMLKLAGIEVIAEASTERTETSKELAEALMKNKDFKAAAAMFREIYAANPKDNRAALGEVQALRQSGSLGEAGRAMKALLKTDPTNHTFQHNMGVILLKSRDPRRAIPYLSDAFKQQPRNPGYAHQLAAALMQTKKVDEALATIEVATQERPDNAGFQFTKAEIALAQKAYKTAEEAALAAVELQPERAAYHVVLSDALAKQPNKTDKALSAIRMALTLDFDNPDYKDRLAQLLKKQDAV